MDAWWTDGDSNPDFCNANAVSSQLDDQPMLEQSRGVAPRSPEWRSGSVAVRSTALVGRSVRNRTFSIGFGIRLAAIASDLFHWGERRESNPCLMIHTHLCDLHTALTMVFVFGDGDGDGESECSLEHSLSAGPTRIELASTCADNAPASPDAYDPRSWCLGLESNRRLPLFRRTLSPG